MVLFMKKTLLSLLFIGWGILTVTGCSSTVDSSEAYKGETPGQIYQAGKSALKDKSYAEAVKRFEALDVQYPFGDETANAQLYLIYAYYMKEDYALAVAAADRYIRLHPTSPYVDYAYYMRGVADYYQNMGVLERIFTIDLATRDLSQLQKSYQDFSVLTSRFPNSRYTPSAHQFMIYLRNVMAEHEFHIAQYYFDRKAYLAAANRAAGIVAHYQGAPKVVDSLVLMAKSYHYLGMKREERETLAVLHYNYPGMKIDYNAV